MLIHFSTLNVPRHMEKSDSKEENVNKNLKLVNKAVTNFKNSYGFCRQQQAIPGSHRVWSQGF